MGDTITENQGPVPADDDVLGNGKKQIFLNAFDMSTVGHLSPGQWKVCDISNLQQSNILKSFRTLETSLQQNES